MVIDLILHYKNLYLPKNKFLLPQKQLSSYAPGTKWRVKWRHDRQIEPIRRHQKWDLVNGCLFT